MKKSRILNSNVEWEFIPSSKTLRISGSGKMPKFLQNQETGLFDDNPFTSIRDEIETIIVDDGVTTISGATFWNCSKLKQLVAPNVLQILPGAFYKCASLTEAILTDVITIGFGAFEMCESLTRISPDYPSSAKQKIESLQFVDEQAFSGCKSLEKITFPEVKAISMGAFYQCTSLKAVSCERLDYVAAHAFRGCVSLEECRVHQGCLIAEGAFEKSGIQNPTKYVD